MLGGRIDDLSLTTYRETLDEGADTVRLMRPVGEPDAYFATFGWPVTLVWDNGAGLIFRNAISVDEEFMFTFAQSVENTSGETIAANIPRSSITMSMRVKAPKPNALT